jgi:triphosphoribosyl-dephospho-CoA synthetase
MKKDQKVRILRTNQIATVVEVELIKKGGKVHRYCHLKTDKQVDLWLDSSELGDMVEHCRITFKNDGGQEIVFDVVRDYRKEELSMRMIGRNPENLKEHHGINILMAELLLEGFRLKKQRP